MKVTFRIQGQSGPNRHRHRTSLMICDLTPSVDLRGWNGGKPLFMRLPGGRPAALTSTPCHFGGERWWVLCPACGRRCLVLYGAACRLCRGAVHESTTLSPRDRLIEKAITLRRRLGQRGGGLERPFPTRPKHMHQRTYARIRAEYLHVLQKLTRAMAKEIGMALPEEELSEAHPSDVEVSG